MTTRRGALRLMILSALAACDSALARLKGARLNLETVTVTGFFGRRLWPGAEVYLNPEGFQGLGFNKTRGVAGFPNGEATKAGGDRQDRG